jgi:hypothetical protein
MQNQSLQAAAIEAGKVLDTLAALSVELACHCDVTPDTLVLEAGKLKEACDAIDDAVSALKRILAITDASGASIIVDSAGHKTPRVP